MLATKSRRRILLENGDRRVLMAAKDVNTVRIYGLRAALTKRRAPDCKSNVSATGWNAGHESVFPGRCTASAPSNAEPRRRRRRSPGIVLRFCRATVVPSETRSPRRARQIRCEECFCATGCFSADSMNRSRAGVLRRWRDPVRGAGSSALTVVGHPRRPAVQYSTAQLSGRRCSLRGRADEPSPAPVMTAPRSVSSHPGSAQNP